jgi:cytoskeletal protein CcmA (bactofilin family)
MFTSKKDSTAVSAASAQPSNRAARSSPASMISADLIVNGTLISTGDIQIEGRVEGDVRSVGLVIGEKAFIHGEVCAEDVTVRGRIQGSIRARKVLLCSTSRVEGNILHEAFAVETGAFFEGNCRHAENPLADDAPATKTPSSSIPASASTPITSRPLANETTRPLAAS